MIKFKRNKNRYYLALEKNLTPQNKGGSHPMQKFMEVKKEWKRLKIR